MPDEGDNLRKVDKAVLDEVATLAHERKPDQTDGQGVQNAVELDDFGLPVTDARRWHDDQEDDYEDATEALEDQSPRLGDGLQPEPAEVQANIHTNHLQPNASPKGLGIIEGPPKADEAAPLATILSNTHAEDEERAPVQPQAEPKGKAPRENVELSGQNGLREASLPTTASEPHHAGGVSEWSHQQQLAPHEEAQTNADGDADEWQEMPAYATHTIYDDWGKVLAREAAELDEEVATYGHLGGAGKGYTKVQLDEDAKSATSLDDDTAYLFKAGGPANTLDEDDEGRDMLSQMQATKDLLTEGQRIAYVGLVRLSMVQMVKDLDVLERTKGAKKQIDTAVEATKMWSQKMMVRLYGHMDIDSAEQIMIEQLADHGVIPEDLTPTLMQNARVKNPTAEEPTTDAAADNMSDPKPSSSVNSPRPSTPRTAKEAEASSGTAPGTPSLYSAPPPYDDNPPPEYGPVKSPSELADKKDLDIDLRWTVLCDLFLVLIADSIYDARSRTLLERVGAALSVPWLEICRFEKRITDALEMQEAADKENWNEGEHMEERKKSSRNKKLMLMGLATVGGGLVIGLSAGLLAPVIGAGLAAGFTTIGVAGTSGFLAGAGGAAIITTTGVLAGGTIAVRASDRRLGAVKTFEYRPLHNNKRVNLIVTVAGWMTGKVDDIRLPYSTVDPIMGDIYSVFWEPEMLQSMGDTINILATEALTQGLQQILGSTILIALMAAIQLPVVLTKLSYLIDNPWSVSLTRADAAGLILADSLIDRNLGVRPVTLVGFSLGARVILSCLKELAARSAFGLIQNVYLFGSPMIARKDEYLRARSVVSGRFVNGYASNDWILGYLFRATSGGIMRVAGLAPVEIPGIENHDVTQFVPGHMAYRGAMPKLLREVGWVVESLEFYEIEDPDPENHVKRQRELINEIEEARRNLETKPSKRGLRGLFSRSKKLAEKKEWETYDERTKAAADASASSSASAAAADGVPNGSAMQGAVLFDIDAIRAEAVGLAAQGIEIREIKGTMPPMRLNLGGPPSPRPGGSSGSGSGNSTPYANLRHTQSYSGAAGAGGPPSPLPYRSKNGAASASASSSSLAPPTSRGAASPTWPRHDYEYDEYDDSDGGGFAPRDGRHDDTAVQMTFESPDRERARAPVHVSASASAFGSGAGSATASASRLSPSPAQSAWDNSGALRADGASLAEQPRRPQLQTAKSVPLDYGAVRGGLQHSTSFGGGWAEADEVEDEELRAEGQDFSMTFE